MVASLALALLALGYSPLARVGHSQGAPRSARSAVGRTADARIDVPSRARVPIGIPTELPSTRS